MIKDIEMKYSVGPLLYSPALNGNIAKTIARGGFGSKYSIALCLEDTISDAMVGIAEEQACVTVRQIYETYQTGSAFIPKVFIRVRSPEQISSLYSRLRGYESVFTGFIFPKYTVTNCAAYNQEILRLNEKSSKPVYMMPILESGDIVSLQSRIEVLGRIKEAIDSVREFVLNVRVGGNDFSNEFATRRHFDETIYDIFPIAQLLADILTFFSREYVVSGPVWEYFSSDNDEWKNGLKREMKLDRLNGFIGKTVIHPKQIPVVTEMMKVTYKDYEDAKTILNWDSDGLQVGKSYGGERMNEVRTNYNWAKKTLLLSELYGIV